MSKGTSSRALELKQDDRYGIVLISVIGDDVDSWIAQTPIPKLNPYCVLETYYVLLQAGGMRGRGSTASAYMLQYERVESYECEEAES